MQKKCNIILSSPQLESNLHMRTRASTEKNFQGWGATEKIPKISKKYRKIALFSLFQGRGGQQKKDRKIAKKGRKIAF